MGTAQVLQAPEEAEAVEGAAEAEALQPTPTRPPGTLTVQALETAGGAVGMEAAPALATDPVTAIT
jgi:hypothetical protein